MLLALLVPILVAFEIYTQYRLPTIDLQLDQASGTVLAVPQGSQSDISGFHSGDEILTIDGVPYAEWGGPHVGVQFAQVRRGAQTLTLELVAYTLAKVNLLPLAGAAFTALFLWGSGLLLLIRQFDRLEIRLLFLFAQCLAIAMLFPMSFPEETFHPSWARSVAILCTCLAAALLLHFFLTFPVSLGTPRLRVWGAGFLYPLALASAAGWISGDVLLRQLGILYVILAIMTALLVLAMVYLRWASADGRRRMRQIIFSTLLAGLPILIFYLLPEIFQQSPWLPLSQAGLFVNIAPIGFLFAITRHNLFGIDRLLNRALVYIILSALILLIYLGLFVPLYRLLPDDWLAQALLAAGLTLLVGLAFNTSRNLVQRFVDRLFYGGWYDYPGVVETISAVLSHNLDRAEVHHTLTCQVPDLMQLSGSELWISDSGAPEQSPPNADTNPASPSDLTFLLDLQGQNQAVWRVKTHRSGEDLSETDRRILETLAQQAQVALNNVLLIETLRQQIIELRTSRDLVTQKQHQLLRSREEERGRLARELHDGPIQTLVGLNLQLGLFLTSGGTASVAQAASPLAETLQGIRGEVRTLLADLRQVCAELRPPMLDALGLGAALHALADDWNAQNGIKVSLDIPSDPALNSLPTEVPVNLYRIVQEALGNIARHAQARWVQISLRQEVQTLKLCVSDDGCGFSAPASLQSLVAQGHFGLAGMQERAALIGAQLSLQSAPGHGTQVYVSLPLNLPPNP